MSDKLSILLVDDDEAITAVCAAELRADYLVSVARSGEEGLEVIRQGGIDILVADVEMPGMGGLALVATVKAEAPEVVRIVLTGSNSLQVALEAINSGEVFKFLTKPWKPGELSKTVVAAAERVRERKKRQSLEHGRRVRELEKAAPGVTAVAFDEDGAHRIDGERVLVFAEVLPQELHALLKG